MINKVVRFNSHYSSCELDADENWELCILAKFPNLEIVIAAKAVRFLGHYNFGGNNSGNCNTCTNPCVCGLLISRFFVGKSAGRVSERGNWKFMPAFLLPRALSHL